MAKKTKIESKYNKELGKTSSKNSSKINGKKSINNNPKSSKKGVKIKVY